MTHTSTEIDRNIALELVRATEAAAIRAYPWIGNGEKNAADGAAVDAMREVLNSIRIEGRIVIGEGEKDGAPMLFNGEHVGAGGGPAVDIAVDPIDGTTLTAAGLPNALSVIAATESGAMLDASATFYMNKIVTGPAGAGVVDIRASISENLRSLARATSRHVSDLQVAVLDRPRHHDLIRQIRLAGARTRLLLDGDVAGGINAARRDSDIDMCVGIGGSPEGITTACAVRALDGHMQAQLWKEEGTPQGGVLELDDLVGSEDTIFVCTGVTDGDLVRGVRTRSGRIHTESLVIRSRSGTIRRIVADHSQHRWPTDTTNFTFASNGSHA
jgi:fructose-1,6-bisphosphatase II